MSERAAVWVEVTSVEHGHGGPGWELGTCLWSPTENKSGSDRYGLMNEVAVGDEVLHFVMAEWPDGVRERRLCGRSTVKSLPTTTSEQPPLADEWAGRSSYFRTELEDYREFNAMVSIDDFVRRHGSALRAEVDLDAYPFTRYGNGVRLAAGLYLRRASPWLASTLAAEGMELSWVAAPPVVARSPRAPRFRDYADANEAVSLPSGRVLSVDPTIMERGVRSHARTQNQLAAFLRSRGLSPQSPTSTGPDFDLAWESDGVLHVAEVKSVTLENEVAQLRLGLGQVLHYRHSLSGTYREVRAYLVLERRPVDHAWIDLCDSMGVVLSWAPDFPVVALEE